ncbi:Dyp-type peroxidase [Viridothelium virens]|uniref:Dyp-type peroxidase n=1 Tax=Viridothelium virens TaxID=1048519 RepID=A0A6A6H4N3_VIRVR|nr:Dyp-type peroxidase [Viridothelium virens]
MMADPTPAPLALENVQGDILGGGLPKKAETYYFFRVENAEVKAFRSRLAELVPLITTSADVAKHRVKISEHKRNTANEGRWLRMSGVNLAFSQKGLKQLEFQVDDKDKINDAAFEGGMINDTTLNDQPNNWLPEFRQDVHGLIVVTGDSQGTINARLLEIQTIFKNTIHEVKRADGHVRPGEEDGHEHFGYLGGVSQPAILGVDDNVSPGQELVRQGIILLGREGDTVARPSWALDGSFLTFRYLSQRVPEFQRFVDSKNPRDAPKDFLGARLVGRWKSDDEKLGTDPTRNDNFRYDPLSQERCPFAAHTRKTNPRSDLPSTEIHRILRRGIPFGPEVTEEERQKGTIHDRGLLFKAYQSNNINGFQFIQSSWANNTNFPFLDTTVAPPFPPKPGFTKEQGPGFDPIIGQALNGGDRDIILTKAGDPTGNLDLPVEWVVAKGGEYFFSPSIPALKSRFASTGSSSRSEA